MNAREVYPWSEFTTGDTKELIHWLLGKYPALDIQKIHPISQQKKTKKKKQKKHLDCEEDNIGKQRFAIMTILTFYIVAISLLDVNTKEIFQWDCIEEFKLMLPRQVP